MNEVLRVFGLATSIFLHPFILLRDKDKRVAKIIDRMLSLVLNGLALLTPAPHAAQQSPSAHTGLSRRALIGTLTTVAGLPALASADQFSSAANELLSDEAKLKADENKMAASRVALKKATAKYEADKQAAANKGIVGVECDDSLCAAQRVDLEQIAALKEELKEGQAVKKRLQAVIQSDIRTEEADIGNEVY